MGRSNEGCAARCGAARFARLGECAARGAEGSARACVAGRGARVFSEEIVALRLALPTRRGASATVPSAYVTDKCAVSPLRAL